MATTVRWRLDHNGIRDVAVRFHDDCTIGELAVALARASSELSDTLGGRDPELPPGAEPLETGPLETGPLETGHLETEPPDSDLLNTDSPGPDPLDTALEGCPITLSSAGRVFDPAAPAASGTPRSGSTVGLRRVAWAAGETPGTAGPEHITPGTPDRRAPVTIRSVAGSGRTIQQRLDYGDNGLSGGISLRVDRRVVVRDHGVGVTVNGVEVRGNAVLRHGDLLRWGRSSATVALEGILRPPAPDGPIERVPVSRGTWTTHEADPVELPTPPGRQRHPSFPWLTAMVPLSMAAALWLLTRSVLMMGFMAFSFLYVLASGIESRRESRSTERFAIGVYLDELASCADELSERRRIQDARDQLHHPTVDEALGWVDPRSHRLWERSGAHPRPLVVRLGIAHRAPDDPAVEAGRAPADLAPRVAALLDEHDPTPRPLTVDLASSNGLAVIGDDDRTLALCTAIVAQLAILDPPEQLSVELLSTDRRWNWVRWLPHLDSGGHHAVRVVEVPERPASTASQPAGSCTLWRSSDSVGLPDSIRAVVQIDNAGIASLQVDHEPPVEFELEGTTHHEVEPIARRLSGAASGDPGCANPPPDVDPAKLGLLADPAVITESWEHSEVGLAVPLGQVDGGGVLSIDLTTDGPHALVAGTTGSGKSELLRTLLIGLAARHPPTRANFLLVDYKGGAAFGPLATLPHCVGLVTDLGTTEVERTLVALRAELRRRETVAVAHGVADMNEIPLHQRPASLLLVVDEFAALVAEVPAFLDGVLDIAQRGRSLGVHLILATQRPAGVISDAVRTNTSLRIALRLPDPDDSNDVIDSPAAARIPRGSPGRALVRLAHDTLVDVQVAHTGAALHHDVGIEVRMLDPTQPGRFVEAPRRSRDRTPGIPTAAPESTQLEALVHTIEQAAVLACPVAAHRPVPPPLPGRLPFEQLRADPTTRGSTNEAIRIGLVDRPDLQSRPALEVDPLASGGVLVVGGARSGASSTLASIAQALVGHGGWSVHAIDATGGLSALLDDGAVETVVDGWDHEPVRRLLELLTARLGERQPTPAGPPTDSAEDPPGSCSAPIESAPPVSSRTMVLVDGFGVLEELQAPINRGWATEALISLAMRGRRRGIVLAVAARRRSELPPVLANVLAERIALRCSDEDEAALLDAPPELADPELPPGRCWTGGHWAQIACPSPVRCPPALSQRQEVARLPTTLRLDSLAPCEDGEWVLPVGLSSSDLSTAALDLSAGHALVVGPPRSGCSTALAVLATAAGARGIRTLHLRGPASVEELRGLLTGTASGQAPPMTRPPPVLVLVDEIDRRIDEPELETLLEDCLEKSPADNLRIVAAAEVTGVLRCYSPVLARLRMMRTGILLGPDAHTRGDVLHHDLEARDDVADSPGRGWLTSRSSASLVQLATP